MAAASKIATLNTVFNFEAAANTIASGKPFMVLLKPQSMRAVSAWAKAERENAYRDEVVLRTDNPEGSVRVNAVLFTTQAFAQSFIDEKPTALDPEIGGILEMATEPAAGGKKRAFIKGIV